MRDTPLGPPIFAAWARARGRFVGENGGMKEGAGQAGKVERRGGKKDCCNTCNGLAVE